MFQIALLTDFGYKDGFVGSMKGVIQRIHPSVPIIDLSHEIQSFDILEASLVLNASFSYFPRDTIFICVVDPGVGTEREAIIVQTEKYFFVAPNNGVLTLPLKTQEIKKVVKIENPQFYIETDTQTFHGRDIFAPAGAYLSKGVPIENFGNPLPLEKLVFIDFPEPEIQNDLIIGEILRFDKFGNALTNIKNLPEKFKAFVKNYEISKVSKNFLEGEKDKPNLIKGSFGFYEIFVPQGSAEDRFKLEKGEKIRIKVEE